MSARRRTNCACAVLFALTALFPVVVYGQDYRQEIDRWRTERMEKLKAPDGYLNLTGLLPLAKGMSRFALLPGNEPVLAEELPNGAETIGRFRVLGRRVLFESNRPGLVTHETRSVNSIPMQYETGTAPTVLAYGAIRWFVIQRGSQLFVRVRDLETDRLDKIQGFDYFPVDASLRVEAKFIPSEPARTLQVPSILGIDQESKFAGTLEFSMNGQRYALEAIDEGDNLFVVFGDETNGSETYGGGRFLDVARPQQGEFAVIDFNKAYNPPCSFSSVTTCPLPTENNVLPFPVRAGEKKYTGDLAES